MKSLQYAMLPDDDNGDVLRAMLDDGDDLTLAREIDFLLVFADESSARAFADAAAGEHAELLLSVPTVDEEGIWQVAASRHMAPAHAEISRIERELTVLAESFGGYADGWECGPGVPDEA